MDSGQSYTLSDQQFEDSFDPQFNNRLINHPNQFQKFNFTNMINQKNKQGYLQTRARRAANISQNNNIQQNKPIQHQLQKRKPNSNENNQLSDLESKDQNSGQEEKKSVFSLEIGAILWTRKDINGLPEYLIKYKNRSFLHLDWLTQEQVLNLEKSAKNKLNRFKKKFEKKLEDGILEEDILENRYFDPVFLEVDRILSTTELFSIIHQKKANQIKNKWSQSIMLVSSKLLNFSKHEIHYGIYFHQPVNPEKDGCPDYKTIITNPIDIGTILNRVFLDYYKNPSDFWKDIGLVWKNCSKYYQDEDSDIRIISNTLKQCSIYLYRHWHKLCLQRYIQMLKQYQKKLEDDQSNKIKQQNGQLLEKQALNNQDEIKSLQQKIQNLIILNPQLRQIQQEINLIQQEGEIQNSQQQQKQQQQQEIEQSKKQELKPCSNVFLEKRRIDLPTNMIQIEKFNPGEYNFKWILEQNETQQKYLKYQYKELDLDDLRALNLNREVDKLYLVKWKNLSYSECTWQYQSQIASPEKIQQYKNFNKALDKQTRMVMINQKQKHKNLLEHEIQMNQKKKSKYSPNTIQQLRNKLYFYDIEQRKQMIPYNHSKPPIYKNLKLLRDYQLDSLNWLIQAWYKKRNVILADEMGLGKTIQSISFLNHLISIESYRGPFLVIAPLTTLQHWKRTVEEWTNLNCILYHDSNGKMGRTNLRQHEWFHTDISTKGTVLKSQQLFKFQILIVSYEVFLLDFEAILMHIPFQFIIIDQAHRLKNQNAKILNCLKKLPCKRILLLTGTPIQNNTDQLWSLLNYIEPSHFPKLEDFRIKFGDLNTSQQVQHLHKVLKPYILRRMKQDVQQTIPPLQQTIIDIEMTTIQKTIYRALYEKNKAMLLKGITNNTITTSLNNLEMQLRKCCNHPFLIKEIQGELLKECNSQNEKMEKLIECSGKVTLVDKLLQKSRNQGKKVLIFSQFTHMLVLLEQYLKFKGYRYQKIDGQVKAKQRQNAIDRYNNPQKKREVFLLSTKAGGIGINLTSANVVIIFDSDWNPQNDVQATARAHRIGQENQVIVYRLITAKTYQSEMFERSMKKLGLDQAIFLGGNFKNTDKSQKNQKQNQEKNKLNKQETEMLLRKGIVGLLGDQNNNGTFFESNIDEILKNNSRTANFSLIGGSYSLSKSSFVSSAADKELKINDPNFWNIVLNNYQSRTQKILNTLSDLQGLKNQQAQKKIMQQISDCVNILIENKLSLSGYNADDQNNLNKALTNIANLRLFNMNYRQLASNWIDQISKPSRRFKKIVFQDVTPKKQFKTRSRKQQNIGQQKIYVDSDQPSQQINIYQVLNNNKPKQLQSKKDQLLKRILCCYCDQYKCILFCKSFCKRGFHQNCKNKLEQSMEIQSKTQIQQFKMTDDQLKQSMDLNYICKDCSQNMINCFICKKKGKYFGVEYNKNKKERQSVLKLTKKKSDNKQSDQLLLDDPNQHLKNFKNKNQVTKCSTANCSKFYHPQCIEEFDNKQVFKFIDNKLLHFRCSLHYCCKCLGTGDNQHLMQCLRCPRAFHIKCTDQDLIKKINKRLIICQYHNPNEKKKQNIKNKMLKKLTKANKLKRKKEEKSENLDLGQDDIQKNSSQSLSQNMQQKEKKIIKPLIKNKKPLLTYQDFGVLPPEQFDYTNYKSDWCRYCGSRFSSNFTQGPWGPKTLCTVHYINWKQKKTLILDPYANERPTQPINPHDGQQIRYMSNLKWKQPDVEFTITYENDPELTNKQKRNESV